MTGGAGGALEGMRVLDLTRNAPGPFCAMLLADHGADVIQIADARHFASYEPVGDAYLDQRGKAHDALSRNKRSVGLDLKSVAGQAVLHRLVAEADVLIVEWRPGVAERLKADYATLRTINPRLVYCAISGYGQAGARSQRAGHDLAYVASSGLLSLMKDRGGRPIVPPNIIADFGGGALAAFAILAAVAARARTGQGQLIDASLTGAAAFLASDLASVAINGPDRPDGGKWCVTGGLPFYDVYETKDGRYMTVSALEAKFFRRLCEMIGCPEHAGGQWQRERHGEMREAFARAFRSRTQAEWVAALGDEDVCAEPVADFADAVREHCGTRDVAGEAVLNGTPFLSATPATLRSPPAIPFAHTDEILEGIGCSREEIERLRAEGAVR